MSEHDGLIKKEAELRSRLLSSNGDPEVLKEWVAIGRTLSEFPVGKESYMLSDKDKALFGRNDIEASTAYSVLENCATDLDEIIDSIKYITGEQLALNNHNQIPLYAASKRYDDVVSKYKESSSKILKIISEKEESLGLICGKYNCNSLTINDFLESKIKKLEEELFSVARREDWEDIFEGFKKWVNTIPDYKNERALSLDSYINGCNVVGVSCTENTRTLSEKGFKSFDVVIIDEVSKATPPELLIPMLKGKRIAGYLIGQAGSVV